MDEQTLTTTVTSWHVFQGTYTYQYAKTMISNYVDPGGQGGYRMPTPEELHKLVRTGQINESGKKKAWTTWRVSKINKITMSGVVGISLGGVDDPIVQLLAVDGSFTAVAVK